MQCSGVEWSGVGGGGEREKKKGDKRKTKQLVFPEAAPLECQFHFLMPPSRKDQKTKWPNGAK